MGTAADLRIAGRVAFTYPDFVRYELARFFIVLALEMQSVAVGWQVYDITKRPPESSDNLLPRIRAGLRIAAGYGMASRQVGACDLCDRGFSRHCSHVQLAGEPRTPAAVGRGRAFSKCSGVELEHISGCDDSRAGRRR